MTTDQPQIPLALFRKMAASLSPAELDKIPAEKLPEQIPIDLLSSISEQNAAKIDELMMRRNQMILRRRRKLTEALGADTAAACYISERTEAESPAFTLKQMLRGIQPRRTQANKSQNATEAVQLFREMNEARGLALAVREDLNRLLHYRKILRPKLFQPGDYQDTISHADARLATFVDQNHDMLGRYYAERAMLCLTIMESYSKMRETHSSIREELAQRINALSRRLMNARSESSLASQSNTKTPYVERLSEEVKQLFSKMRLHDIALHKSDLTLWIDAVLDISLYRRMQDVYDNIATRTEDELAKMVRVYFLNEKLDEAEQQSTRRPLSEQQDSRSVAEQAELFLQRYLQTKQQDMASHHGISAADRLYAFKRVERRLGSAIRDL